MAIDPLTPPSPVGLTTTTGGAGTKSAYLTPEESEAGYDYATLLETSESPYCYTKRDDGTYTRSRSLIGRYRHSNGSTSSKVVSRTTDPVVYVTGDPEDETLGGFTVVFYSSEDFTPHKVRLIEKKD